MEPNVGVGCLWFLVIAVMFFAQHHVCDAYFVPAINVFVDKMRKRGNRWGDEAVAGATICALGCNGPELFSNLLSLYTHSDAGIGVVVGSEVFNLLVIIGATVLAAPTVTATNPLELERIPFTRDCAFYFLSIVLLFWTLQDKKVDWNEACILLAAAAVYVCIVYFTQDIAEMFCGAAAAPEEVDMPAPVEEGANETKKRGGKMHGIEVDVQEIIHGAAMSHPVSEKINMEAMDRGIVAMPVASGKQEKQARKTGSIGFQFENPDALLGPIMRYDNLKEVCEVGEGVLELEFSHGLQHVTLKLTCKSSDDRKTLLDSISKFSLGRAHVHKYDPWIFGAIDHFRHEMVHGSCCDRLLAIPEFFIDFILKLTLSTVDVKDTRREDRWPLCFLGAMCWLAAFSYAMLEVANQISYNIPVLTTAFLGITLCAVGTSFPNAVASVLMAQQNKPAAAIANALGSNVQNVFLAMAMPWVIYMSTQNIPNIPQEVKGINEGVYWMMGTLLLVLTLTLMPPCCKLTKAYGGILMLVYVAYVVCTSGEAFNWWSPLVQ